MAIPLTGSVSIGAVRAELFASDFMSGGGELILNDAEDGVYVALNKCSPYLPSSDNPSSLSEWRGYNHLAPCLSKEAPGVIGSATDTGACEQIFDKNAAGRVVSMTFNTIVHKIREGAPVRKLYIMNIEKFPAVKVEIKCLSMFGYGLGVPVIVYVFEGDGANYVPWDGVPNQSGLTEANMKEANNNNAFGYFINIWYNDGSGRVISNVKMKIINPSVDGYYFADCFYSPSGTQICNETGATRTLQFNTPISVNGGSVFDISTGSAADTGFYRMYYDTSIVYQVLKTNDVSKIVAITSC